MGTAGDHCLISIFLEALGSLLERRISVMVEFYLRAISFEIKYISLSLLGEDCQKIKFTQKKKGPGNGKRLFFGLLPGNSWICR